MAHSNVTIFCEKGSKKTPTTFIIEVGNILLSKLKYRQHIGFSTSTLSKDKHEFLLTT